MAILTLERIQQLSLTQLQSELTAAKKVIVQLEEMKQDAQEDINNLENALQEKSK